MNKRLRVYKDRIQRTMRLRLGRNRKYLIGFFEILLPAEHLLPEHQAENRMYDRLLPFVGALLPASTTVIDVGANVGDTLASMVSKNVSCSYVCIEPEDKFFPFLEKTKSQVLSRYPEIQIDLHQQILSSMGGKRALKGVDGTRTSQVDEIGGVPSVSLDSIVQKEGYGSISLLKIDVDGWDWDVILSSRKLIEANRPIIYFEMYVQTNEMFAGYESALALVKDQEYEEFYIFDSFGAYIFFTSDIAQISELARYLLAQAQDKSTRTMYYLDILCGVKGQSELLKESVRNYLVWGVS